MSALYLIAAHLIGDFLLQNHWMQRKGKDTGVCFVHVTAYAIPWVVLVLLRIIPEWFFVAVYVQHFLQDRFQLHVRWMKFYGQTTPEQWPMGPLCVDQAMHLSFIGALALLAQL